MKVLFDISSFGMAQYGLSFRTGIFRVVENLMIGLQKSADCQPIFCSIGCNYKSCRKMLEQYPELKGYTLSVSHDWVTSSFSFTEPLRIRIAKLHQRGWKIPFRSIYRWGKNKSLPIAPKDIESSDCFHSPFLPIPDQIHQHRKIAKFITIHDLTPVLYPEHCAPATRELMKMIFDSIHPDTSVICVSHSTKQDVLSHRPALDPARVSVIHLAAADHFYPCTDPRFINDIRLKYKIPEGHRYFLALSTLQPHKNFERVIRCFIRLIHQQCVKDLCLVIVGADGLSSNRIYKILENEKDVARRIILTGFVPDEDLSPLYSGCDAFIFPSLYEGFGLPPLEAMQCGAPVITSNVSSLPEVVGDAAILVDPLDEDALCQAMLEVYENENLRRELSQKSLARSTLFSWDKTIREHVAAYKKGAP